MIRPILQDSDPLLRQVSEPIGRFDDALRDLAWDMYETIKARDALGLAAVQIGQPVRLILIRDDAGHIIAMANPRLVRTLKREEVMQEGCLSVGGGGPRRFISRPAKCDVAWFDLEGGERTETFRGWAARAVQHEIDHLDGILMTDKPTARR